MFNWLRILEPSSVKTLTWAHCVRYFFRFWILRLFIIGRISGRNVQEAGCSRKRFYNIGGHEDLSKERDFNAS
ncbi:hypothetical protein CW304_18060 [Bacillus sp. UFRGS-B20]|nr:hypothetical protein CW304_18060 [Bacillus sp. UFRGS-B20]